MEEERPSKVASTDSAAAALEAQVRRVGRPIVLDPPRLGVLEGLQPAQDLLDRQLPPVVTSTCCETPETPPSSATAGRERRSSVTRPGSATRTVRGVARPPDAGQGHHPSVRQQHPRRVLERRVGEAQVEPRRYPAAPRRSPAAPGPRRARRPMLRRRPAAVIPVVETSPRISTASTASGGTSPAPPSGPAATRVSEAPAAAMRAAAARGLSGASGAGAASTTTGRPGSRRVASATKAATRSAASSDAPGSTARAST